MSFEKIETVFFNVLDDLKDYLDDLTIVGGWMTTADIDFGVDQSITRIYPRTIFETLSSLNYSERHPRMDRMFPVVLLKEKIPIEFITYPDVDIHAIEKIVGGQIQINKINKFDFLLKYRTPIQISVKKKNKTYVVNCPRPSAFLYHKGATFIDRENKKKQAKDLYYMYFVLRYAPDIDVVLKEIVQYRKAGYFKEVQGNLSKYFERISSPGCLLVEQENGPDEYISDLRQDIFERFGKLRE